MNDLQFDDESIIRCQSFVDNFHRVGADPNDAETHYYQAIQWAIEQVAALDNVEEIRLGNFKFLVARNFRIGLYAGVCRTFSK